MRSTVLISVAFLLSCSSSPAVPLPDGGDTGGGTSSAGGSSATGGGTAATGGGTTATGGGNPDGGMGTGGGTAAGGGSAGTGGGMVQMANDAGTCMSACDCNVGEACQMGHCRMATGGIHVYCCTGDCPANNACQSPSGMFGLCPGTGTDAGRPFIDAGTSLDGGQCTSACDCVTGEACLQGGCVAAPVEVYCCNDMANCPGMDRCQRRDGMFGRCGGMMMPPPPDSGFDYCPFVDCASDAGICELAGCNSCDPTGSCAN